MACGDEGSTGNHVTAPSVQERRRRRALALGIGCLLYLVYWLTFSGAVKSDDERYIIDTIDSMAIRGNLQLNQTYHLRRVLTSDVEPAQPLLAMPLYWLAYRLPWMGNVHAVLFFNPVVVALTAILVFYYALHLGYDERTAFVGALLLGLATIAWPYAKTFFREPLAALGLLGAAFCLEHWRRELAAGESRHWMWLALSAGAALVVALSKAAMLLTLPALLALAYPGRRALKEHRRQVIAVAVGLVVAGAILVLILLFYTESLDALGSRYVLSTWLRRLLEGIRVAGPGVAGLLISPARGIFLFSPILVLALGAPVALPRGRWRESWLPLALSVWFAFVYAAVRASIWFGGLGWGGRFMVPLMPFLMIATLPLIDRMLSSSRLWPKLALAALGLGGFIIQLGGAYVDIRSYDGYLHKVTGLAPWDPSIIWSFRWSQAIGSLLYLPQADPDFIWLVSQPDWLMIAAITAGIALIATALMQIRRKPLVAARAAAVGIYLSPVLIVALTVIGLWRAYEDPRYQASARGLHTMRAYLEGRAQPDDTIMLATPAYVPYFTNYYKGDATWYGLPVSPGERSSCEGEPEVVSDRVEDLIAGRTVELLDRVTKGDLYNGGLVWLVVRDGPNVPCATRPVEWYLAKYGFPVGAQDFDLYARVVEYLPIQAPTGAQPDHLIDAQVGDAIRLAGYDVVTNDYVTSFDTLHPGDMLGISLVWEAIAPMEVDYTTAVHVIDEAGQVSLQQDRPPMHGFAPTSQWKPGDYIRDNFGLVLPDDLPPGDYELRAVVYTWPWLERLPVIGQDGAEQGDSVLLGTLQVALCPPCRDQP